MLHSAVVGARLRFLRERAGLSQRKLAVLVGVNQPTINHWESGHRSLTRERAASLVPHLGSHAEAILLDEPVVRVR